MATDTRAALRLLGVDVPGGGEPVDVLVADSIETIGRAAWDTLFAGDLENWHYLLALERARLEGCEPLYFAIRRRGMNLAALPAFIDRRERRPSAGAGSNAREHALILGSPFSATCRAGFAPRSDPLERADLLGRLLRAARDQATRLGLAGLFAEAEEIEADHSWEAAAASLGLRRERAAPLVRLALPAWSLGDYLSCLEGGLRSELLDACARSAGHKRRWRIDLDRELPEILDLCREVGLSELTPAYFRNLLGPGNACAACLVIRFAGRIEGFSLVLHDTRRLREKVTVLSPRSDRVLLGDVMWLETVRFCLEHGIESHESCNPLSLAVARRAEVLPRSAWFGA
jgi:uncharacterized protein